MINKFAEGIKMEKTEKFYYTDMLLKTCRVLVTEIKDNTICLDRTVAYPEGGGQISDAGWFDFKGLTIPFFDVKKGYGRIFSVADFPTINVDTPVYHTVSESDIHNFTVGDTLIMNIDVKRRILITVHHSAIHLALMFASELRNSLYSGIRGCSITETSARLDFFLEERFSEEDILFISNSISEIISSNEPIYIYPYDTEKEAWYWKCRNYICPCGGTHVRHTGEIGKVLVRRRGIGKGRERLIVEVSEPVLSENDFHV
jgi:alanyl-tRNA synthetase